MIGWFRRIRRELDIHLEMIKEIDRHGDCYHEAVMDTFIEAESRDEQLRQLLEGQGAEISALRDRLEKQSDICLQQAEQIQALTKQVLYLESIGEDVRTLAASQSNQDLRIQSIAHGLDDHNDRIGVLSKSISHQVNTIESLSRRTDALEWKNR